VSAGAFGEYGLAQPESRPRRRAAGRRPRDLARDDPPLADLRHHAAAPRRAVVSFAAALTIAASRSPRSRAYVNEALAHRIEASVRKSSGSPLHQRVVTQIGEWRIVAREVSRHGDRLRGVASGFPRCARPYSPKAPRSRPRCRRAPGRSTSRTAWW